MVIVVKVIFRPFQCRDQTLLIIIKYLTCFNYRQFFVYETYLNETCHCVCTCMRGMRANTYIAYRFEDYVFNSRFGLLSVAYVLVFNVDL